MAEESKFSVLFAHLLAAVLDNGRAKLELVECLPVYVEQASEAASHDVPISMFNQTGLNAQKSKDDCHDLIEFFKSLSIELKTNQTFKVLTGTVEVSSQKFLESKSIDESFQQQQAIVRKLKELLIGQHETEKKIEAHVDDELWNASLERHQQTLDCEVEKKFNEQVLRAQLRQSELELSVEGNRISEDLLTAVRTTCDTEDVHFRVSKFYTRKLKELNHEIDRMTREYETQIESVETDYLVAKNELQRLRQLRQAEQEKFDKRENEMKDHRDLRRKKDTDKQLKLQVVVIQAWWRGELVRHHLGPFKAFKKRSKEIREEFRVKRAEKNKKRWRIDSDRNEILLWSLLMLLLCDFFVIDLLIWCRGMIRGEEGCLLLVVDGFLCLTNLKRLNGTFVLSFVSLLLFGGSVKMPKKMFLGFLCFFLSYAWMLKCILIFLCRVSHII